MASVQQWNVFLVHHTHPSARNEKPGLHTPLSGMRSRACVWPGHDLTETSSRVAAKSVSLLSVCNFHYQQLLPKLNLCVCVCVYRCWKHEPSCRGQSEYKSQYSQKWSGQVSYKNVQRLCFWRWGFKLKANKNTTEHITICFSFFEGFVTLNLDPVPLNTYWTSL